MLPNLMILTKLVVQLLKILRTSCVGPGELSRYSDSLRTRRSGIEYRWKARFTSPVQTGPVAHPASYTMGTGVFPGDKAIELYICSPFWAFVASSREKFTFTFT